MKPFMQNRNEEGLTLVEVLASIVILSIVLTTFLLIYAQSAKTTYQSEETIDATYVAQTEMEKIYEISKNSNTKRKKDLDGYNGPSEEKITGLSWDVYNKKKEQFYIEVKLTEETPYEMTRVVIKVYEELDDEHPKAQMENLFMWGSEK